MRYYIGRSPIIFVVYYRTIIIGKDYNDDDEAITMMCVGVGKNEGCGGKLSDQGQTRKSVAK